MVKAHHRKEEVDWEGTMAEIGKSVNKFTTSLDWLKGRSKLEGRKKGLEEGK